ncbi:PD-(D/E)XK nuclease family protein [uncultured Sphaerochaeta sp.]|uniref:PD-(D/E)XK nuclease family protein n=1 Tax=uncultured Sphaerochaeta sp. TaxID=886478 RepID=UPI002A0A6B44|nr:PD-(D/E)XK nuclease family protein [uncultured Sphaerochaeta sp.]
MEQIKRTYVSKAFDEGYTCVFPNEVSARFYLVDYALHSCKKAILQDRAISFDTFRARFLPHHENELPSNTVVRELFVARLLREPHGLSYFINQEYPEANGRFSRYIASLLPLLQKAIEEDSLALMPRQMQSDVLILYHEYSQFLATHGYFEPNYEKPSLSYEPENRGEIKYRILFFETIGEARSLWETLGSPAWITFGETPSLPQYPAKLEVFGNFMQELHATLRRIRNLLAEGIPARDIVIGCASPSTMLPSLEQEAWLYDIPLSVSEGKSPLLYPSGRFLSRLKTVDDETFSLESMKALLLDTGFPWRDLTTQRNLIASAVKSAVVQGSLRGADQWQEQIQDFSLIKWYKDFKRSVHDLCASSDIDELRRKLNHFQDTYFIDSQWTGTEGEDVYSFCLDAMENIKTAMKGCEVKSYPGIFTFLLNNLDSKLYVPQQKKEGVAVYAWPLTATLGPKYHFVLSLDHESSQCIDKPLALLPRTVEGKLRKEIDTTEANFRSAMLGGGQVFLSCHTSSYEGEVLPPSFFIERDLVCQKRDAIKELGDPFESENLLWGGQLIQAKATKLQSHWFDRALKTVLAPRQDDFTRKPVPLSCVPALKQNVGEVFVLQISPTSLDLFLRCPYAWACKYLYKADQMDFQVPAIDHRAIGSLLHSIYEEFFSTIEYFDPMKKELYRKQLLAIFDSQLLSFFGENGPNPPTRAWIVSEYRQACTAILDQEEALFADCKSVGFEQTLRYTTDSYSLYGRIDRIISLDFPQGKQYAVIDYKKGEAPYTKITDPLASYQLPVYRMLVGKELGGEVVNASYFSVKKGMYSVIWNEEDTDIMRFCDEELEKRLFEIVNAVNEGHFEATPSKEHCKTCVYRQICRRRYATR